MIGNPSTCHPDRPRTTKTGLCKPCYDKLVYQDIRRVKQGIQPRLPKDTPCSKHPDVLVNSRLFCKKCNAIKYEAENKERLSLYRKEWAIKNKDHVSLMGKHGNHRRKFGMEPDQTEKLLADQDGVCAICKSDGNGKSLHLDHCHDTLKIRQFLCQKCNQALGLFYENIEVMQAAIDYLKKHKEE